MLVDCQRGRVVGGALPPSPPLQVRDAMPPLPTLDCTPEQPILEVDIMKFPCSAKHPTPGVVVGLQGVAPGSKEASQSSYPHQCCRPERLTLEIILVGNPVLLSSRCHSTSYTNKLATLEILCNQTHLFPVIILTARVPRPHLCVHGQNHKPDKTPLVHSSFAHAVLPRRCAFHRSKVARQTGHLIQGPQGLLAQIETTGWLLSIRCDQVQLRPGCMPAGPTQQAGKQASPRKRQRVRVTILQVISSKEGSRYQPTIGA